MVGIFCEGIKRGHISGMFFQKPKQNTHFILCSGIVSLLLLQFVGKDIMLGIAGPSCFWNGKSMSNCLKYLKWITNSRWFLWGYRFTSFFSMITAARKMHQRTSDEDAVPSLTGTSIETLRIDDIEACDPFGLKNPGLFWLSCSRGSLYLKEVFQLMILYLLSNG